ARVVVARQAAGASVVAGGQDGANRLRRAALLADPVIEIRRKKAGLVADVVAIAALLAGGEEEVEAALELGFASGRRDQPAHVLRHVERVGPRRRLVEVVLVPGADKARVE